MQKKSKQRLVAYKFYAILLLINGASETKNDLISNIIGIQKYT